MPLPPRYLAQRLTEPLPIKDGKNRRVLRTIADARNYMLGLPDGHAMANAWQHSARLILNRASADAVTKQVSMALFLDAALDIGTKPIQPRKTR